MSNFLLLLRIGLSGVGTLETFNVVDGADNVVDGADNVVVTI